MIKKLLVQVPCKHVLAGLGAGLLLANPGLAQDTNAPTVMKPTVVTGSYIPTAETVGPAPVQTLSSATIQEAGTSDSLLTLKKLVPGFTGSGNYLGSVNNNVNIGAGFQAFTGQSYAQIRNLPTLVLLDGQRVVTSALSGAQAVDLNTIPLSMIERIEVLKDGASAIYGSDAIGGVINVITKKNWNGFEIGGRFGFPTEDGKSEDAWQYKAYIVGGASTENTRFTMGAEDYHQNPLLTTDRNFAHLDPAGLEAAGIAPAVAYLSPSFPGKVQDGSGSWILAGSPFAVGLPGYNPAITSPPKFGNNQFTTVSAYNTYAEGHGYAGGVYLPFSSSTLLNTTDFGTTSILDQNRRQFWASFEHDIFPDTMTVYSRFNYSDNTASGELAPSPVIALYNPAAGYQIAVPGNNPYNPFGIDLGLNGSQDPRIRSRFVDSGNRIFDTFQDTYNWVGGLKGNLTPNYGYDTSFDYSHSREEQQTRNAINGAALNSALIPLTDGEGGYIRNAQGQILSQLIDAAGNNLPVYNIFATPTSFPGNSGNAPSTIQELQSTLFTWGESELWNAQGVFHGTPLDLPAGKLAFAAGGQFIHEDIQLQVDGLSKQGLVPGLNPQNAFAGGTRETAAGFIEVNIPVIGGKDMHVPGFYDLEITASGRYQSFDPGGDAAVPKIGIRWQPLDEQVTLRANYNKGFIAPSIFNLFGPDFASNPAISTPGGAGQVTTTTRANPNLEPQNSEQFGGGIVISPKAIENLTVSVDYYHVVIDKVPVADAQGAANSLNALGSASPYAPGFTFFDGTGLTTTAPNQVNPNNWGNLIIPWSGAGAERVEGIDFSLHYGLPIDPAWGKLSLDSQANLVLSQELSTGKGRPEFNYAGTYTTIQGLIPDYSINAMLTYEYQGLTATASVNYLPAASDPGGLFPEYGQTSHGLTLNGLAYPISAYYTIDLQLSYELGKGKIEGRKWYDGTRFTVGVNNITDEQPPLIASAVEDNTDKNNYDVLGRFVYFEFSKKF